MATTYYSDHYSGVVGATGHFTTLLTPQPMVQAGKKHARVRRTAALLTATSGVDLALGDIIRFCDIKSSTRITEVLFSMDANWGDAGDFNVGLYEKGLNNDGAVIDADLFAAAQDWKGTIARVDQFAKGTLDDWDRGKQAWELVNAVTASTYASDPGELWTVAVTASSDNAVSAAAVEMLCEVFYTAGD